MTELFMSPLFGLIVTLGCFRFGVWLYQRSGRFVLLHTFISSMVPLVLILWALDISYEHYMVQTDVLRFFLGPATVALAWPLYRQLRHMRVVWKPLLVFIVVGTPLAAALAVGMAYFMDVPVDTLAAVTTKSITTPIALEIMALIGGSGALAAGIIAITGVVGVMTAPFIFRLFSVEDDRVRGLTLGLSAHAIGTAYAFDYSEKTGAFSSLALGLVGLLTAIMLPFLWPYLVPLLTP